MLITPVTLSLIGLAFMLAGMVKDIIGMGLPTVAMSVLGLPMGTLEAVALLALPTPVTNTWPLLDGAGFGRLLSRFAPLLATLAAGALVGATTLAHVSFAGGWNGRWRRWWVCCPACCTVPPDWQ